MLYVYLFCLKEEPKFYLNSFLSVSPNSGILLIGSHNIRRDKRADNTLELCVSKGNIIPSYIIEDTSSNTPGDRLKLSRFKNRMSIIDLATVSGLSVPTISCVENNRGKFLPSNVKLLSSILKVPIWYLGCYDLLPEETIGQKIRKSRLYYGQTIEEYSHDIKINPRTLRDWENDIQIPLPKNLAKLAERLSILGQ